MVTKIATLAELDGPGAVYSVVDILKANAVLDIEQDANKIEEKK